jgi:hypothetical protein
MMILAARQSGKSTICAIYALWHALNNPGALVLVLSPSLRQSSLLFRTITTYYQDLGRPIPSDVENTQTLELANKSIIVALPGVEKTIRGYSASLLVLDESALILDELYTAVRPMIAVHSDAKLFCIGTPHGRRGWYFDTWENGDEFYKVRVTAEQCPRISPEFLARERREMGEWLYKQEYECEWIENEDSLFSYEMLQRSLGDHDEIPIDWGDDYIEENYVTDDDSNVAPPFPKPPTADEIDLNDDSDSEINSFSAWR